MKKKTSTIFFTVIFTLLFASLSILAYLYRNIHSLNISLTYNWFYQKGASPNNLDLSISDTIDLYKNMEINLEDYQASDTWLEDDFEPILIEIEQDYVEFLEEDDRDKLINSNQFIWKLIKIKRPYLFDFKVTYDLSKTSIYIVPGNIEKEKDPFRLNYLDHFSSFKSPNLMSNRWKTKIDCISFFNELTYIYTKVLSDKDYLPDNCYNTPKFISSSKILWAEEEIYYYIFVIPLHNDNWLDQEKAVITIDLIDSNKEFDSIGD